MRVAVAAVAVAVAVAAEPRSSPPEPFSQIDSLLTRAEDAHIAHDTPRALEALRGAEKLMPAATIASFELGNLLLAPLQAADESGLQIDEGAAAEAEGAFRRALSQTKAMRKAPSRWHAPLGMAYNNLANLLSLRGRYAEAETLLRTGLTLQPLAYQYNGLANILMQRAAHEGGTTIGGDDPNWHRGAANGNKNTEQPNASEEEDDDDWIEEVDEAKADASSGNGASAAMDADGGERRWLLEEARTMLLSAIEHEQTANCVSAPPMLAAYHANLVEVLTQVRPALAT